MLQDAGLLDVAAYNGLLNNCQEATRRELFARGRIASFAPGDPVLKAGDSAEVVLFPLQGRLQISKTSTTGRRQVFCHLDPQVCTPVCMLGVLEQSPVDMIAVTSGSVLLVARDTLSELTASDPVLANGAWGAVSQCMAHFVQMVENLSFHKVGERVILALLQQPDHQEPFRRTQAELAAEVGTTREVVARCLAELQDSGAIKLGRGRISVLDRDRLRRAL